jgi:hypothetical protein
VDGNARKSPHFSFVAALAHREDNGDRIVPEAARNELECLHRSPIEPLSIIDQADQGLVLGFLRKQPQDTQPEQKRVRGVPAM